MLKTKDATPTNVPHGPIGLNFQPVQHLAVVEINLEHEFVKAGSRELIVSERMKM